MSTAQINEIISLLQAIADSSMANKIAFIATLVSACALLSSIYFSHKTNVQYLNSLSPLLSCELSENAGILYLTISNTGQSKATKIKVSLDRISNNGERNEFVTDDIFKEELEASEYFGIGYKKLKLFVQEHSDADFVLWNGNRALIKREQFEKYMDSQMNVI